MRRYETIQYDMRNSSFTLPAFRLMPMGTAAGQRGLHSLFKEGEGKCSGLEMKLTSLKPLSFLAGNLLLEITKFLGTERDF
jgi:hypothetical protein